MQTIFRVPHVLNVLNVLNVLTVLASLGPRAGGLGSNGAMEMLSKQLPNSSPVPFWRYGDIQPFTCQESGYFPDDRNCRYYYHCVNYVPGHLVRYIYQCDEDRVFSVEQASCVVATDNDTLNCAGNLGPRSFEEFAPVSQDQVPVDMLDLSTTEDTDTDATTTGTLDIDDTTQIVASDEFWDPLTDPTFYDQEVTEESIMEDDSQSTESTLIGATITSDEVSDSRFECVEEGFFGDPEDCSKFIRCVRFMYKFVKHEFVCPRKTYWDDRLKTCNFQAAIWRTNCKHKNVTRSFVHKVIDPIDRSKNARVTLVCPSGFRQHPDFCNAFYQCTINETFEYHTTVFVCPEGSIFDERNIRCSTDHTIRQDFCAHVELSTKQPFRILDLSEITCRTEGRFSYNGTCANSFFECKRDLFGMLEGYLLDCPPGQLYSEITKGCAPSELFPTCV